MKDFRKDHIFALCCIAALLVIIISSHFYYVQRLKNAIPSFDWTKNYYENAQNEVDKSFEEIMRQNEEEMKKGVIYRKIIKGSMDRKEIALTFDDGPHPFYTRKILEVLKDKDVKATFFLVGRKAAMFPRLVKMELSEGHEIGNHTFNHVNLKSLPELDAATEIKSCGKVLSAITGKYPHLFRPPGGNYDRKVIGIADSLGYTTVLWTANVGDCQGISEGTIRYRLFSKIGNGGIILFHDGIQASLDILPQMIDELRSEGYTFVTVDELIKNRNFKKGRNIFESLNILLERIFNSGGATPEGN